MPITDAHDRQPEPQPEKKKRKLPSRPPTRGARAPIAEAKPKPKPGPKPKRPTFRDAHERQAKPSLPKKGRAARVTPILDISAPWTAVPTEGQAFPGIPGKKRPIPAKNTRLSFPMFTEFVFSPKGLSEDETKTALDYNKGYRLQQKIERVRRHEIRKARAKHGHEWDQHVPLGEGQSEEDYVKHGTRDVKGLIGKAVTEGIPGAGRKLHESTYGKVTRGLGRASTMRESEISHEEAVGVIEDVVGKSLINAAQGESFNPLYAGLQLITLPLPLKGLPMISTAVFRFGSYGFKGLNMTRMERNMAIKAAAEGLAPTEKAASSPGARAIAGALSRIGAPEPIVKFVRNDPRAKRWFEKESEMLIVDPETGEQVTKIVKNRVWVDPAKSRTGKLAEKAYDKARPVLSAPAKLGVPFPRAKTQEEKYMQALARKFQRDLDQSRQALVQLNAVVPKSVLGRAMDMEAPWFYALRMVGKNVDPGQAQRRFAELSQEALLAGNNDDAAMLGYHAAMFGEAAPLVKQMEDGAVVFADDAPEVLKDVYMAMEQAANFREDVYINQLDLLLDANARARKTAEELWYYGANYVKQADYIDEVLAKNVHRRQVWDVLNKRDPANAQEAMDALDLMAKKYMMDQHHRLIQGVGNMMKRAEALRVQARVQSLPGLNAEARRLEMTAKRLKARYERGPDPDAFYKQWSQTLDEFPDSLEKIYKGSGINYELQPFHGFSAEKVAANLKLKLNPQNLKKGVPSNKRVWRTIGGVKIAVIGDITPEQWVNRVLALMPDAQDRARWSAWYDEFQPVFENIFGEDAEALMRGFAVSQANASPGTGLQAVFRIMSALQRGETVEKGYGSVVAKSIATAIDNGEIDKGVAAKLSDFIDSLMRAETRTWMGGKAEGGRPVAVDVHAARDRGLVDKKMVARLKEQHGITNPTIDNPQGSPSGVLYERTAEWYERLTDHLNKVGFDGRTDWQPRQVQALGWATVQLLHGVNPQDFAVALAQNTYRATVRGVGKSLTYREARKVSKLMEDDIAAIVNDSGAFLNGIVHDVNMIDGRLGATLHIDVIGDPEKIDIAMAKLATVFGAETVMGVRAVNKAGAKATLTIASEAFSDSKLKAKFIARLKELNPKVFEPMDDIPEIDGMLPAAGLLTGRGQIGPKGRAKFIAKYEADIKTVADEFGIDVTVGQKNHYIRIGENLGEAHADDSLVSAAATRYRSLASGDLADTTKYVYRDPLGNPVADDSVVSRGLALLEKEFGRGWKRFSDDLSKLARQYEEAKAAGEGESFIAKLRDELTILDPTVKSRFPWQGFRKLFDDVRMHAGKPGAYTDYQRYDMGYGIHFLAGDLLKDLDNSFTRQLQDIFNMGQARLAGLWSPSTGDFGTIVVTQYGKVPTFFHELMHMMQAKNQLGEQTMKDIAKFLGVPVKDALQMQNWTQWQREEFAHIMEAVLLGFDAKASERLPVATRTALKQLQRTFNEAVDLGRGNASEMLARLDAAGPEGRAIRDAIENQFWAQNFEDFRFLGANDGFRDGAKMYMPEVRALPVSFKEGVHKPMAMIRARFSSGARESATENDMALRKEFRAALLKTGAFDKNVLKGTVAAQVKAMRVYAMTKLRNEMLKFADDAPKYASDIAIPINPRGFAEVDNKQLSRVLHLMDDIDESRLITESKLSDIDHKEIDGFMGTIFQGSTKDTEEATARLASDILEGVAQPIEGVKWIRREDLLSIGDIFKTPFGSRVQKALKPLDWMNDYARFAVLVGKPSYIPMNLAGNAVMLLIQQGPFAPVNMARAFHMHSAIGDHAAMIDFLVGHGSTKAIMGGPDRHIPGLGKVFEGVGDFSNYIIDKYPRRAAFLYEARKLGYDNPNKIVALLTNPDYVDDLGRVVERTKNAMVNYDNLSHFEKQIMTRLIFVYPWLKGSAQWAGRFMKDHPVLAMMFAGGIYLQQDRLKEAMPNGYPNYLKWYVPIGTTERDNEEMPLGFRLDQFLTMLQPMDLAYDFLGTIGARGGEVGTLAERLNPIYFDLVKFLTGYDPFRNQPQDPTVPNLFKGLITPERFVVYNNIMKILRTDAERRAKPGMYHTNRTEDWLKLFLGSIAPTPIDPEIAAEYSQGDPRDQSPEQRAGTWEKRFKDATGYEPNDQLKQLYKNNQVFSKIEAQEEARAGTSLSKGERAYAYLRAYGELNGREMAEGAREAMRNMPEDEADEIIAAVREKLGLTEIDRVNRQLSELEKSRRLGNG